MRQILCLVLLLLSANAQAGERLMFGILPGAAGKQDQMTLRESFTPLVEYVGRAAGAEMRMDITQNFKAIDDRADKGRYHLLMANTHVIAHANQEGGYYPVAKFKDISAVLLVPLDSAFKKISDLKNTRIGIMNREALVGTLAANMLKANGVLLNKDFKSVQEFKFQDAMVDTLVAGGVDVVTVNQKIADEAIKKYADKVRILAKSDPVPGFAIALSPELSSDQAEKITKALLSIGDNPAGKAALAAIIGTAAGNTKLSKASADEYLKAVEVIDSAKKLYPPLAN